MSKHTPGPWRTDEVKAPYVWAYPEGSRPVLIAMCDNDLRFGPRRPCSERMANARLIAAAKDLLAHLKECVSILKVDSPCYADCMCGRCYIWRQAEAEIEKIMGTKEEKNDG